MVRKRRCYITRYRHRIINGIQLYYIVSRVARTILRTLAGQGEGGGQPTRPLRERRRGPAPMTFSAARPPPTDVQPRRSLSVSLPRTARYPRTHSSRHFPVTLFFHDRFLIFSSSRQTSVRQFSFSPSAHAPYLEAYPFLFGTLYTDEMTTTVSNGNGTDVVSMLKKTKPPALKKLGSWKDEAEFDSAGNPKTPRTSTTPGTNYPKLKNKCIYIYLYSYIRPKTTRNRTSMFVLKIYLTQRKNPFR